MPWHDALMTPTILVATWSDGLFTVTGENSRQESAGERIEALAPDGYGGVLAIASGHSVLRRTADGEWTTVATSDCPLACCVAVGDVIFVGTNDARVLRVGADGSVEQLHGFASVPGRDGWYAGSAIIDGER